MRHNFAPCWLRHLRPRRIAWLAGDRSRISRLPAMVARVLGVVVLNTLARSSVTPAVFRPTLVG
jgi:hypothetical protein